MKIKLDTSQFGLTNNSDINDIQAILDYIQEIGITSLDACNESETILGKFDLTDYNVCTKTIRIDKTLSRQENFERFRDSFYLTQRKLGYIVLYALMIQDADDLLSPQGLVLWDLLNDFKDKEYIYKLGVNVRTPEQLINIIDMVDIDIVQLPLNLLDQRFVGLLPELKRKGIEIHTRSTFLQGILLMNEYQVPEYFREIKPVLQSIPEPKAAYALSFLKHISHVDKITIGCNKKEELEEIVRLYDYPVNDVDYRKFRVDDEKFILPEIFNQKCKYM